MRYVFMFLSFMALIYPVHACDACGCVNGPVGFGILQGTKDGFISLRYRYAQTSLKNNNASWIFKEEDAQIHVHKTEISLRFLPYKNLLVSFLIPYVNSQKASLTQSHKISGLGDISAIVQYVVYESKPKPLKNDFHRVIIGSGLKVPNSKYNVTTNKQVIKSIQSGSGSFDIPLTVNYLGTFKNWAWQFDAFAKVNTQNSLKYKQGNMIQNQFSATYKLKYKKFTFLPICGLQHFYAFTDVQASVAVKSTGMQAFSPIIQCNVQYQKLNMNVGSEFPVFQKSNADGQKLQPSFSIQFSYLIN